MPSAKRRRSSSFVQAAPSQCSADVRPKKRRTRRRRRSGRERASNAASTEVIDEDALDASSPIGHIIDTEGGKKSSEKCIEEASHSIKVSILQETVQENNPHGPSASSQNRALIESLPEELGEHLNCGICTLQFRRPFATVPCGHIACYDCLRKWFQHPSAVLDAEGVPLLRRRKTCPSCRTLLIARPVEMYTLKAIVELFRTETIYQDKTMSGLAIAKSGDIWEGIFHPEVSAHSHDEGGIVDHEDGGISRCPQCLHEIWNGICTGCNQISGIQLSPATSYDEAVSPSNNTNSGGSSEGYDGSFIDDGENIESEGSKGAEKHESDSGQILVTSSDESEASQIDLTANFAGRRRIIESSDEESCA